MEKKKVFITGASSGIGRETALYFSDRGWEVIATMRRPDEMPSEFRRSNIHVLRLDVLDSSSIENALNDAVKTHGRIDVLVNNAGFAVRGVFEASTSGEAKRQFDTNVLGLFEVCRKAIPIFRAQRGGALINIASVAGHIGFPLYTLYNSSKWAVEGFSEALHYELSPFGIHVKLIEPGIIKTDFYGRSMSEVPDSEMGEYADFVRNSKKKMASFEKRGSNPQVIAKLIYRAAVDRRNHLRYYGGSSARLMLFLRKILPDSWFFFLMRKFSV